MFYQVAVDPILSFCLREEAFEGVGDGLAASDLVADSRRVEDDIFSGVLFEPLGKAGGLAAAAALRNTSVRLLMDTSPVGLGVRVIGKGFLTGPIGRPR